MREIYVEREVEKEIEKEGGKICDSEEDSILKKRNFEFCKQYYSIGWMGVTGANTNINTDGDKDGDIQRTRRQLGVSLTKISFALLKAVKVLKVGALEGVDIVKSKINFFNRKATGSPLVSQGEEDNWGEEARGESARTRSAAAAVTYRETRLLSSIAAEGIAHNRDVLKVFWSEMLTEHTELVHYSTALFELIDAYMGAGDGIGAVSWARDAIQRGAMLPPMRVKELLIRYCNTPSLRCLPTLLPLLAKLSATPTGEDNAESSYTPRLRPRKGESELYLSIKMSVLRGLCVTLLEQGRVADARVLLQSVHPIQWPYDELLLALATARDVGEGEEGEKGQREEKKDGGEEAEIEGGMVVSGSSVGDKTNEKEREKDALCGVRRSTERKKECMAVLTRREDLSVPLSPIKSSTARALLAMHADGSGEGDVGGGEGEEDEERQSQKSFRMMVARAVKQREVGKNPEDFLASTSSSRYSASSVNSNGRIGTAVKSSASSSVSVSVDDASSGLLALLTLYNLTDSSDITVQPDGEYGTDSYTSTSPISRAGTIDQAYSGIRTLENSDYTAAVSDARTAEGTLIGSIDRTSPPLSTSAASASASGVGIAVGSGVSGSVPKGIDSISSKWIDPESKENLLKFLSDVQNLGTRSSPIRPKDSPSPSVSSGVGGGRTKDSIGLRVTGSKKSWKKSGGYGTPFRQVDNYLTDESPSYGMKGMSGGMIKYEDEQLSVDIVVCRELASSLLSTVQSLIRQSEEKLAQVQAIFGEEIEGIQQKKSARSDGIRRKKGDDAHAASIEGAVSELFSTKNQEQADRMYASFENVHLLCTSLLHLSALRGDTHTAAVVMEQMAVKGGLTVYLDGADGDLQWQVSE